MGDSGVKYFPRPGTNTLDSLTDRARLKGVWGADGYTPIPGDPEIPERHVMINDHPPIPHLTDDKCWCVPELVHEDENGKVFRHRRQQ